jgi:CRP-like cAMP-binding protein
MLRKDRKVELIRAAPLFSRCSKSELATIAQAADEVTVPADTELVREGDRGREFMVIVEGAALVKRKGRKIAELGQGDFFGEIALVSRGPRTATVTTTAPSHLLVITDQAFVPLIERMPKIQSRVMEALADRLANTSL